jgi:two-component system response regulator AtoC
MTQKEKIYIVEDDELLSLVLSQGFKKEGYEVTADMGMKGVAKRIEETKPDLILLDVTLPHESGLEILGAIRGKGIPCPVIMLTADDSAETAVNALKHGAYDYITKPFEMEKLKILVRNALEASELKRTVEHYRDDTLNITIIGKSAQMVRLVEEIKKIARQRVLTLLVLGESGTGKELVAKAIHNASPACLNPFVAINCAALPQGLLESELFGYEKGAFTDAKGQKKGLFEEADGGTLVLDEIGDMDISLQAKLLRVLENRTMRRIGGYKEIPFDVMVVATTNRQLAKLQKEGKFRQDLYFRLNMFTLRIPPLRERREDIPLLAEHFFAQYKNEFGKPSMQLSKEALQVLMSYDWPGNVRELKSLFAKVCLLEESEVISAEHIMQRLEISGPPQECAPSYIAPGSSLEEIEKNFIRETLKKTGGNMTQAAKMLDITYDTLRYRMKKFDIR